jgi:hypothetical protein
MAMTMRERIAKRVFEERYPGADWESVADADGRDDFYGIADAVLSELETPTEGMLNAALVARYPDWGTAQYADPDDARVIDGMRVALSASARAAKEGK